MTITQFDFDSLGKASDKAIKDKAREISFDAVVAVLTEAFGADFVSAVGTAEVAVSVGTRTIEDEMVVEVPVAIKVTAKEFHPHSTASGKAVEIFDRVQAAEDFAVEKAAKEAEAAEKAAKKAAKVAADKAAREKAKAAKAAKKGAE